MILYFQYLSIFFNVLIELGDWISRKVIDTFFIQISSLTSIYRL